MKTEFIKPLSFEGAIKTIEGKIVVTKNYSTKTITGTNASTHDDYKKDIPIHKIEGFIEDKIWWIQNNIETEHLLLSEAERCEKQMSEHMITLANSEPIKSFEDKMKELGF